MKIKEYIKELLFTNQGVIIPGLGGFVSEYEPAAFDVSENKFLPPSKKITFNPDFNYQDNLLIDFVAKKEKVKIDEATNLIKDFVNDTKSRLNKNEDVDFPGIGVLSKKAKSYYFKQSKDDNLLTDSFGLQSVRPKKSTTPKENIPNNPRKSYKKTVLISLGAVIFICVVAFSWYFTKGFKDFKLITSNSSEKDLSNTIVINTPAKNLDSIAKADSIKALINQSIDENTDLKDALFYEEPAKEEKPQYSAFHIVAGSFKQIKNAEIFLSELKGKGYNPKIIQSSDTLFRIALYSFTEETEALKELYKIRQNTDIKSVWILKVK